MKTLNAKELNNAAAELRAEQTVTGHELSAVDVVDIKVHSALAGVIQDYCGTSIIATANYRNLARLVQDWIQKGQFTASMDKEAVDSLFWDKGEQEICEGFLKITSDPSAYQFKNGKLKQGKIIETVTGNSTYKNNKRWVCKAVEHGISLVHEDLTDSNGEKIFKETGTIRQEVLEAEGKTKSEKSPEEKVAGAFSTFTAILSKCDDQTARAYADIMENTAKLIRDGKLQSIA